MGATLLLLALALPSGAAEVMVFAAASLTDSLNEIAAAYQKQSGDTIVFNFGASSILARQIEEGAPADIFFSADEAKMDDLDKAGLILNATRKSRLSNTLMIIIAAQNGADVKGPADLATARVKRLALAEPNTVPAGIYARKFLVAANLWPAVQGKVIPTENVRAALAAVESGDADAGIVYATDAAISKKVKVAFRVSSADCPAISYPMAALKASKQPDAAKKFLDYLSSAAAGKVFERFGFLLRP